jgi:CRP-like cAMP-binding protein
MSTFFENNATLLLENPELAEAFQEISIYQKIDKNTILHTKGNICNHFYIIISGIARVFYFKEDKDITCHFATEQESITAIDSFIQRKKSKYNIEALEDLEVLKIAHQDLEKLFTKQPKYERFGRLFLQQAYIDLVQRIDDIQLHTSQERYEILLSKRPELFKRVVSKHIATYLGMTAETFSRIRGKQ